MHVNVHHPGHQNLRWPGRPPKKSPDHAPMYLSKAVFNMNLNNTNWKIKNCSVSKA